MTDPASPSPLLITNLRVERGGRTIVDGLTLRVESGQIYALLGGNGAGKSTTLAALLGFLAPSAGSMQIASCNPVTDADAARKLVAYLPENVAFYETLTARENVHYFMALAGEQPADTAVDAAFDRVGLAPEAHDRRVGGFSKGMRQKVGIALAVLRDVPVLMLDEPTSGLDPCAVGDFTLLLKDLKAAGKTILMVTHDLLGAVECADRIGFLGAGRIVEEVVVAEGVDVLALHRRYSETVAA